jgi:hypothetical protein
MPRCFGGNKRRVAPKEGLVEGSAHRVSEVSLTSGRYTGDGEADMRSQLLRRLDALEQRLPTESAPGKALLPAWLVADLRAQGFSFDYDGRPDMKSGAPGR